MSTLQDLWDSIKDKMQDLMDTVSDVLPAGSTIPIISGFAIVLALIAILNTAGAGKTAGRLEDNAMKYKAGQQQLNSVLGSKEDIGFSKDSEEIIGRANLVLQYKELAELPSEDGIDKMEKALNVDDKAVEEANSNYDDSMIDQIVDFAGDYGGVLIAPGSNSNSNIKLAAFSSQKTMKTVEDGVSNVLYEKIDRTIAGKKYGDATTRNSLIILSSSSINGMDQIAKGSIMYSLFGDSTGTKTKGKYVCTGVGPGTLQDSSDGADSSAEGSSENNNNDAYDNSSYSEDASKSSNYSQNDDLDGEISGGVESEDDNSEAVVTPKTGGVVPHTDGNGVVVITDDDTVYNGGAYNNDGSVNDDWIKENSDDATSDDTASDEESSQTGSSNKEDSDDVPTASSGYSNEDNIKYTDKNKTNAIKVLDLNGNPITENTTADLILYKYNYDKNHKVVSVTISYWNYADSEAATNALVSNTTDSNTTNSATGSSSSIN